MSEHTAEETVTYLRQCLLPGKVQEGIDLEVPSWLVREAVAALDALEADNAALREKYMNAVKDNAEVAHINADYLVELVDIRKRVAELEETMEKIVQWSDAYPLDVFPEPDFNRAAKVLKNAGMTLDAISASNMRHVVEGVGKIAKSALAAEEDS